MGGYGGTGGGGGASGGGGGGGGNPNQDRAREEAIRAANKASQDRAAASIREQAAQRDREAAARNRETISKNPIGGLDQFAKEVGFLEDKYASGTKLGLGDLPGTVQDYYKNKLGFGPRSQFQVTAPRAAGPMDYLQKGYQPPVINPFEQPGARTAIPKAPVINPFEQPGARTAIPKPPLRTRIQDERTEDIRKKALGNIAMQTDKSLMDVSDPSRQGIMSGLTDMGTKEGLMSAGKNYAKKAAINYGLQKLGLGFINPLMGLASLFGFKMPKGTGTKTAWQPDDSPGGDGGQEQDNVIQAGMKKFQPTDQQTAQMDELRRKRMILQGYADKGALNERGMSTLAQMNQLISQYQVDPRSIYG